MDRARLARFAWLSIAAACVTIGLKSVAFVLTGSVGLLSDALESLVNLVGGLVALAMLTVAARPADDDHPYGHDKAEYFSSGVEGTLILAAAASIAVTAVSRLLHPRDLEQVGLGLAVSVAASLVNLGTAMVLLRVARRAESITLEANAHHLLTDVWTSVGVVAGVGLVALTRWRWLDPAVALLVAANIVWTGVGIVRRSVRGLMDTALEPAEREALERALEPHRARGARFHALRSRRSGARRFVSVHVLVPGAWSVQEGHRLLEEVERDLRSAVEGAWVITHLEPIEDPAAYEDTGLERPGPVPGPAASPAGPP